MCRFACVFVSAVILANFHSINISIDLYAEHKCPALIRNFDRQAAAADLATVAVSAQRGSSWVKGHTAPAVLRICNANKNLSSYRKALKLHKQ